MNTEGVPAFAYVRVKGSKVPSGRLALYTGKSAALGIGVALQSRVVRLAAAAIGNAICQISRGTHDRRRSGPSSTLTEHPTATLAPVPKHCVVEPTNVGAGDMAFVRYVEDNAIYNRDMSERRGGGRVRDHVKGDIDVSHAVGGARGGTKPSYVLSCKFTS